VFDTSYLPMPGTNPTQYSTRFCEFADHRVRPILTTAMASDSRTVAA
jgi:hypothetical protein